MGRFRGEEYPPPRWRRAAPAGEILGEFIISIETKSHFAPYIHFTPDDPDKFVSICPQFSNLMSSNNSPIFYHSMEPGEEAGVIDLVSKVFDEFVAPLYSQEGVSEFMKYLRADELTERLKAGNFVLLAKSGSDIIGVVEVRENSHIALLFVEGSHQKNGTGKGLLKMAIETCKTGNPDTRRITVNSSPNAVTTYQNMGFNATKQEQVVNGIRFIPMELSLI